MRATEPTLQQERIGASDHGARARDQARARAARIAQELQRAARHARVRRISPLRRVRPIAGLISGPSALAHAPRLKLAFVFAVLAPTLVVALYLYGFAASLYEAETRFAVRTGAVSGVDAFTSFAGIPSVNQVQDSLIVANFVESRAAVEALQDAIDLRELYSGDGVDPLSRLAADATIEELVEMWQDMVSVSIESPSGIITVRTLAFSPEDAQRIADALIAESEKLVNELGRRSRENLISDSRRELARAEERVRETREALTRLRNEEGIIDPALTAQGIDTLVNELRGEAVRTEQEIATIERTISREAPQLEPLRVRLEAVREQIEALEGQLTRRRPGDAAPISEVMTRFDQLALDLQIAERQYAAAAAALEQARAAAERQQMYLATFVRPVLPEDPVGPRRTTGVLIAFAVFLAVWLAARAASRRLRDRL